ncbi:MAG: NADPH-dependent FMN reductase [Cyclobacteriaceae bacterium]
MINIVVGTNRKHAKSAVVAAYYERLLHEKGAETQILNLRDLPDDFTSSALYENNGKQPVFNSLREQFTSGNKFIFIIPEYNGSYPGVLKAFIDGMEYPSGLEGKKCALVGVSTGVQGASVALSHFTDVLHYLQIHVLGLQLKLGQIHLHLKDNQLTNDIYLKLMHQQADQLIAF